jgi:hypothetical protein
MKIFKNRKNKSFSIKFEELQFFLLNILLKKNFI